MVVTTSGVGRVNKSAFNAVAIDAKKLHNSTQTLAGALTKVPGVKLRESGGVGSDMQLYIDGFSGKHVKIFIDGIPQEGAGAAFDLNNVPINFADRIEEYKGVVPVGISEQMPSEACEYRYQQAARKIGLWTLPILTGHLILINHTCASDKRSRMVLCMKSMLFKTFRIMIIM